MKLFNPVEFKKENVKKTMYGSIFKYISLQHCIKLILKVLRKSVQVGISRAPIPETTQRFKLLIFPFYI